MSFLCRRYEKAYAQNISYRFEETFLPVYQRLFLRLLLYFLGPKTAARVRWAKQPSSFDISEGAIGLVVKPIKSAGMYYVCAFHLEKCKRVYVSD